MAAPNLLSTTTVTGKTSLVSLLTDTGNVITVASNTVVKLNSIILTNSTTGSQTANVTILRSSTSYYLAGTLVIPANSTLVLLGKDTATYLEENDVLQANASANASLTITASYELLS